MRREASFLTAGESYAFDVPDDLDPRFELYGVVGRRDHQRYVVYRPSDRDDPYTSKSLRHLRDVPHGLRMVAVFQAVDVPQARVAYWRLPGAYLFTFVDQRNGPDTDAEIDAVIDAITIGTTAARLPRVNVREPIVFGNQRDPRHRDRIDFLPRVGTPQERFVSIWKEPSWVFEGNSRRDGAGWAARAVTNDLHLTVEAVGPAHMAADLERQAARIAASAVPVD